MKKQLFSVTAASIIAASMISTGVFADEAAEVSAVEETAEETAAEETAEDVSTGETEEDTPGTAVLSGTYVSNIEKVEAYEGAADAIADGSLDQGLLFNAIMSNYYTEAYYFGDDYAMIHYTGDEGSTPGYYLIEDDTIYLGDDNHTVYYDIEIGEDEITIYKGGEAVVFTKILDSTPIQILMEDYSTLEIPASEVNVSDEEVMSNIESVLASNASTETVTEGTAEDGDTVVIDFVGVLEGETEPFDGGSAEGQKLTLGSGTMIDGFEEAIVGHELGTTFDINVTFPEDYSNEDLAGKNATFTITLTSKNVTTTPELTDEWIKEYSAENMEKVIETVDELKQFVHDNLYENKLQSAISNAITEKASILGYDQALWTNLIQYSKEGVDYYASMYGLDADTYAYYMGYSNADEYEQSEAAYYLNTYMIADAVCKDKGIEVAEEDLDQALLDYMAKYGYDTSYTLDEFKELSGDTWIWLYENVQYKNELAINALKENVVIVDDSVEDAAEDAAEETAEGTEE